MDDITTPEEGEELPAVIVEDITDPEPEYTGRETETCQGFKEDGSRCGSIAKKGIGYCRWHAPKLEEMVEVQVEVAKPKDSTPTPYPFHDGAVSENAAIRMIRMAIPLCPIDDTPEIKQRDGSYKPNPNFTGELNCQQAYKFNNMGRWDVDKCVELGHNPYYSTFRRPILEEVLDDDGYVIDTRTRYKVEKRLNVIQVSDNNRHSSGLEVQLALARGCKFLEDFGMSPPCEFRNCSRPQMIDTRYGKFCSERHARLVGADKQQKLLPVASDPYSADQANREREEILENLNIRKGA